MWLSRFVETGEIFRAGSRKLWLTRDFIQL